MERPSHAHDADGRAPSEPAGRICLVAADLLDHVPVGGRPLLLGPWCAVTPATASNAMESVPAYGGGTSPPPEALDETFDEVVRCGALALDEVHGTRLGVPYWSVLTGQFYSALIPVVADLQRRLEAVSDLGDGTVIHGRLPVLVPTSNRGATSDLYFDPYVVGQLASGLASASDVAATVCLHPMTLEPPEIDRPRPTLKTRVARAVRSFATRATNRSNGTRNRGAWIVGAGSLAELRSRSRLREPLLAIPSASTTVLPDTPWMPWEPTARGRLASAFAARAALADEGLAHRVLTVAHLVLPWRFFEGWRFDRDYDALRGLARRRFIVSTYPSENNLSIFATAKASGARLAFYQHGGHYGEGPMGWAERYERRIGDGFFSWGWTGGGTAIPVPSTRLARFVENYASACRRRSTSGDAVPPKYFTNFTSDEPYGFGLGSSTAIERYGAITDVLNPMLLACPQAVVRRHPMTRRFSGEETPLPAEVASEDLDVSTPASIAGSSLVVLDLFRSTTFLECLVVSHPVVIFLAAEPAARDADQAAMIRSLREARVVNVGHDEMQTFWRDCFPDLESWWSGDRVQSATGAYRERFARTQIDWVGPFTETVQSWFDGLDPTS